MISYERIMDLWDENVEVEPYGAIIMGVEAFARALLKEAGVEELEREAALRNVELRREYERYVAECPKYGVAPYTFEEYKSRVDSGEEVK